MFTYDPADIIVLTGIEAVRKRPGMYVGDVHDGTGLHHLLWEVLGNCLDEHLAGRCRTVDVTLHEGGGVTVADDGGGIAVEREVEGVSLLEAVFTQLHASGTLDGHSPHVHVGLHGAGVAAVNALSSSLAVDVFRAGKHYRQSYRRGQPEGPPRVVGDAERQGTRVTFTPDAGIFSHPEFDATSIVERLRELSFLFSGLTIAFADDRQTRLHAPRGAADHVAHLNRRHRPLHEPIACRDAAGRLTVEAALQWADGAPSQIIGFVNALRNAHGGTHLAGLSQALVGMFLEQTKARRPPGAPRRRHIADAMADGLAAVVSVQHHDPEFRGPTRARLESPEVALFVAEAVAPALRRFCTEQPERAAAIVERARRALA
jgi:DNA gyrase subunit B